MPILLSARLQLISSGLFLPVLTTSDGRAFLETRFVNMVVAACLSQQQQSLPLAAAEVSQPQLRHLVLF